jgi:hypothetical protein
MLPFLILTFFNVSVFDVIYFSHYFGLDFSKTFGAIQIIRDFLEQYFYGGGVVIVTMLSNSLAIRGQPVLLNKYY